ncbi:L-ascorbate oxidase [Cyphellophora attinorum]|uniref:L-ascorbate oxidase n=1 Tax=Cyphellophora attinorum TaxID=1664694 RepID=A0A0N0NKC7_9EURO|nr:L-ascorbate oxidase [Phialophora attinorum]KPI37991.1 L-ascorbate oxidase [Phialophora attinorum]
MTWLPLLLATAQLCLAGVQTHDDSFQPDRVLRVSEQVSNQACRGRSSVVVNGTSPGPPVHIKPDETTWVRVYNDMEDQNLTVHWHGLSQSVSPFSDGTPMLSQWPIPPLHFFDYELHPSADEAGTYFYHSHVGFQTVSAVGPLIVDDCDKPPYEYDEERTIMVTEYFNKSDSAIIEGLEATPFVWSGEAMAILVNGNSAPAKSTSTPSDHPFEGQCGPEIIQVEPGKTYRFRNIAAMSLSALSYAIEEHDELTIIEADGSYTQPASVSHMQLGSGQRFDYLLKTKSAAQLATLGKSNFWIQFEVEYRPVNYSSYACLSYDGKGCGPAPPQSSPVLNVTHSLDWLEYTLEPLSPADAAAFPTLDEVTSRVYIYTEQVNISGALVWHFNGQLVSPDRPRGTPYLVDIYSQGQAAVPDAAIAAGNNSYVSAFDAYAASVGDVLEIVWVQRPNDPAGGFDIHPLHAHGGHYYDLGSGPGTYSPAANEAKLRAANYTPVLRDTTFLYKYTTNTKLPPDEDQGWRAWRLRVVDAGVWLLHCHTLQHMIMGMQTVWIMGDAADIMQDSVGVEGYLEYGGNAYGSEGHAPLVNHHYGAGEHGK